MFWNDCRYALRLMRRNPGFAAVAVLSLALGTGANTAIFSLFNTVMLRTLPVDHPEQLVELLQKYPGEPRGNGYWSWRSFEHYRDQSHVFAGLTGTSFDAQTRVRVDGGDLEMVVSEGVPGNYFAVLGLKPAAGRLIGPQDVTASGAGTAAVLSWSYWMNRFHGDRSVLGKSIVVRDASMTIVGIAPPAYTGPLAGMRTDLWVARERQNLALIGRMRSGVNLQQVRAEMAVLFRFTIAERLAAKGDPLVHQLKVEVEPAATGLSRLRDSYGKPLILLMSVVGVLLLLACINMASLMLARGAARQRELAVRVGLGAGRWRLVRQMLAESILFSAAGTLGGVLIAWFGANVLVRIIASGRVHERLQIRVEPDLHLLLFTAAIAVVTGALFGIAPAWYAFRAAPASSLRQSGSGEPRRWRIFGKGLVAAQVALSVLLLTAAAMFLSHLSRLRNADLGFRSDHVLLMVLDPAGSGYHREQLARAYRDLLARLQAIPGVRTAAIAGCTPIQGCGASRFVNVEGFREAPEDRRWTSLSWVSPGYFEALGTPLLAGRDFAFADANRSRVAIISQAMARHYFRDANPIGRHIAIDNDPRTGGWYGDAQPYEVVGVVADSKYSELREPAPRTMYFNLFQENRVFHQFILKTRTAPESVIAESRRAVHEVLKTVAISSVTTLSVQVDAAIVPERLIATLSTAFGVLGAVLAGIGLYGLLAYTVSRRVHEIGVRMALGATPGRITRLVGRDALQMVGAGLPAGILLVLWGRKLAAHQVEGLSAPGAAPILLGAAGIVAIAVLATCLPARRAARVDPMDALRQD